MFQALSYAYREHCLIVFKAFIMHFLHICLTHLFYYVDVDVYVDVYVYVGVDVDVYVAKNGRTTLGILRGAYYVGRTTWGVLRGAYHVGRITFFCVARLFYSCSARFF